MFQRNRHNFQNSVKSEGKKKLHLHETKCCHIDLKYSRISYLVIQHVTHVKNHSKKKEKKEKKNKGVKENTEKTRAFLSASSLITQSNLIKLVLCDFKGQNINELLKIKITLI